MLLLNTECAEQLTQNELRMTLLIILHKKLKSHIAPPKMPVVVVTRPLPKDEGMAEDHGAPEVGQLPRAWTRGSKETKSRQKVSGTKSP